MRSYTFAAAFAALAVANPLPQEIDWDLVEALQPIPTVTIPVVDVSALASTVAYEPSAAASTVAAEVKASGIDTISKRDAICQPQPTGAGPVSSPDTAEAFLADKQFSDVAYAAQTPEGYYNTFVDLKSSNNAYGYMGYTTLDKYDTNTCAAKCDKIDGCAAFNIYFERDPIVNPNDDSCKNPASTTNIKCVFWGGPVTKQNAKNNGQWRKDFHVVIVGSNGYVSNKVSCPPGYTDPQPLGQAAINAPLDCNKQDTYLGVRIFTEGPFDTALCAAACSAQNSYAYAHPPSDGSKPKTCQFYNTYLLLKEGTSVGQYCAMYSESWDQSYATNRGQYRKNKYTGVQEKYTIDFSFTSSNSSSPCPAGNCKVGVY